MRLLLLLWVSAFTLATVALQGAGAQNLEMVGQLSLDRGINADVWAHGNYAYVGTRGSGSSCPGAGVKVIDIADPAAPRLVTHVGEHPNTAAEDVVVRRVENSFFRGDLLALGLQICDPAQPGQRGVELFDVTDPRNPQALSFFDTGPESRGVHELDLVARADGRVLALLGALSRFHLVEVTDPRNPRAAADWNISERLGETPSSSKFTHSALASLDGNLAFLSYWDAGVIILDISDPSNPRFLGRTGFGPDEEGNAHSVAVSPDNRLLLTADEDFSPGNSAAGFNDWGFLRVFDISDPTSPKQLSTFLTAHARTDRLNGPPDNGTYTIHNPFLVGNLGFLSWYSDGIRVVDLTDRRQPLEVGFYVPPDSPGPSGALARPQVWGVMVQPEKNLVLASDINFGLYLMRPVEPRPAPGGLVNAASFAAGDPVAPGSIVSLFGGQMAGAAATAAAQPLPTQLAGTVVKVNGTPAQLFYAGSEQINLVLPPQTPLGTARISVENLGRPGREVTVAVVAAAPGLFTLSQDGRGAAAALRASDQSAVNAARPARAGEVVELFASGLGSGTPAATVTIGGRAAEVLFAGPTPGFTGLSQLNVRVPDGVPGNPEVVVTVAGRASNRATLPVE